MGRHASSTPFDVDPTTGQIPVQQPATDPRLLDAPLPARAATGAVRRPAAPAEPRRPQIDGRGPVPGAGVPHGHGAQPRLREHAAVGVIPAPAPIAAPIDAFAGSARPMPALPQQVPARRAVAMTAVAPRFAATSLSTGPIQTHAFELDEVEEDDSPAAFNRGRTVKLAACAVALLGAVSGAALLLPGQTTSAEAAEGQSCHATGVTPRPTARPGWRTVADQKRALKGHRPHLRRGGVSAGSPTASASTPTPSASGSASASPSASTSASAAPSGSASATPTGSSSAAPSTNIIGTLANLVRGSAGSLVQAASGVYSFSDFGVAGIAGFNLSHDDFAGQGVGRTVLEMKPHTSTKAGSVPTAAGTTNQLSLLMATGSPHLSGFTLQGTEQGHLYNGLRIGQATNARVTDVKVDAVPGNDHVPPGETFGINDWRTTGSVYSNVEVDGGGVGAAGFGANFANDITIKDSSFHNNPYSLGATFYMTKNITLTDVTSSGNRGGLNFERASGTADIVRPVLRNNSGSDISIGSDQASVKMTITDPVLAPGQKLKIRVYSSYNGVNHQKKSDIHVIVNGVDRTSELVQWV